jgi:hypothetical protein
MLSYVCAPYPFLIGVHASLLPELLAPDSEYPMSEVLVVNLDHCLSRDESSGGQQQMFFPGLVAPPKAVRRSVGKVRSCVNSSVPPEEE